MLSSYLSIGEILKPQGVKGEVKLRPITCDPGRFDELDGAFLLREGQYVPVRLRTVRADADAVYLKIEGVNDRDQAEKLRGEYLYVDRAHAVRLPEDAEFVCDLIGCAARDDAGRELGTLTEVLQPGGNDVYVFRGPLGELLVPALKSVILKVDVREKTMLLSAARLAEVAVFED